MALSLPLSVDDRNLLTESKENTQDQNSQIQDSNLTLSTEVAKLLQLDIPFKKGTDPVHVDIFEYEEELRRLNGTSIIQPLQEKGFTLSNTSGNPARLYVNDGRLKITENSNPIVDVPLFPTRGFSKSTPAGVDFDIWSRDRYGSTTSNKITATSFAIDYTHRKLKILFDGTINSEIDFANIVLIEQVDEIVFPNTIGTETSTTLRYQNVTPNTDIITMTYDSTTLTSVLFSNTTGSETSSALQPAPIISNSETITMVLNSTNEFFDLVRGTDYTVDYLTGIITFIKTIQPGYKMSVIYQNEATSFNLVRNTDYSIVYSTGLLTFLTPVLKDHTMSITYFNQAILSPASVASTIQVLIQRSNPALTSVSCIFNEEVKTFTIVSGHGGPTSTVQVIPASSDDLMTMLKFDTQYQIQGKYQNNLLNVSIDGQTNEIKISDFRLCFQDTIRGYNNDDMGFYWSGDLSTPLGYMGRTKIGPLFCSGLNNGKDVAKSIEAQLRIVGSGGFKDCSVHYYTNDQTFVINSGTMGTSSSVHILPASDPNRDARTLLRFNPPQLERGNETSYDTLQGLYGMLATVPNTTVSSPINPSFLSHSILYQPANGININSDFQDYDPMTTLIYDNGSRGLPRLYPNGKLVVDSTNDKIDFFEIINVEKTATIVHKTYESEVYLAEAMQNALNSASSGPVYKCEYKSQEKVFVFTSDLAGSKIFTLLLKTGRNVLQGIANYIGFDVSSDKTGSGSYTSDSQVSFQMQDFFYPFYCKQFDGQPQVIDNTVDELSALSREQEYLADENTMSYLSKMLAMTSYDDEVVLIAWEQLASLELAKVNQEYYALRYQRGAYANHLNESDPEMTIKNAAYENVKINRTNLINNLASHANLFDILLNTKTFIAGSDFLNKGSQTLSISFSSGSYNRVVYNSPAPLVKYQSSSKHIPGRFSPSGLWSNSVTYTPEALTAFTITNTSTGTRGYSYSSSNPSGYTVRFASDSYASILSSISAPYDFTPGDTLKMKIDRASERTATFTATPGYTESRTVIEDQFVIKTNVNDKIDFSEGSEMTIIIGAGVYTGANLATEIQNQLNATGSSTYTVDYNSSYVYKFAFYSNGAGGSGIFELLWNTGTNASTSIGYTLGFDVSYDHTGSLVYGSDNYVQFPIITGVNDTFTIQIDGVTSNNIVITQGNYLVLSLITEMTTQIANDPHFSGSDFTITYPANKFRISSTSKGTGSIIEVYEGINDFLRTVRLDLDAPVHGGGDVGDITAVTASEVASVLNADIPGISATNDGNKVRITTLSTRGSTSTIEITGGTCRTIMGFSLGYTYGFDQDNKLKVDIDSDVSRDPIEVITSPSSIPGATMANSIQGLLRAIASGGYTLSNCGFNETTLYQTFTNALRIVSGTQGTSSTVTISDKTIKIVSNVNNKIDFEEVTGFPLVATVTPGFYNGDTLSAEIQVQLNAIGANNYTVSYSVSNGKMTIASDDFLNLLFGTGVNVSKSISNVIGFFVTDYIGYFSYSSNTHVKLRSCFAALGFDAQTSVSGHSISSVKLNIDATTLTTRIYWLDDGGGNRIDLNVDLTTNHISDIVSAINAEQSYEAKYDYAYLLGRVSEKFKLEDGDTFVVNANNAGNQTRTFVTKKATSVSGSNPCTRIFSGTNDRLILAVDSLASETSVSNELLLAAALGGEKNFTLASKPVKPGSSTINFNRLLPPGLITLNEGADYTLNHGTGQVVLNSALVAGDNLVRANYTYFTGTYEIILGTQYTPEDIAARIQQKVRALVHSNIETQATFSGFTCQYSGGKYVLTSGNGGTSAKLHIYDGSVYSAAPHLKLGVDYGGVETEGSGDVVNSNFVTASEIVSKLSTLSGMTVSATNYLKLVSTVQGDNTRVNVGSCALLSKLGFDSNGDSYPATDLASVSATSLKNVVDQEIKSVVYVTARGWDAQSGNVDIQYYTVDKQALQTRIALIPSRVSFIGTRQPQIPVRASAIVAQLTPALYTSRKNQVKIRLNKKNGSYVKVGKTLAQKDNNDSMTTTNDQLISDIETMLA